jgi:hypothetical protein
MPNLESIVIQTNLINSFEIEKISLISLLFQSGYLTINRIAKIGMREAYELTYPNLEVKASLNECLLDGINKDQSEISQKINSALLDNQFEQLQAIFTSHFAGIPHDWYRNNKIAEYEGFYASVVYSYFTALGYDLVAEDATNHGRIDLSITMPDKIILLEFKLTSNGDAASALAQIKAKNYAQKFVNSNKPIYAIGMSFDATNRNVVDLASEQL